MIKVEAKKDKGIFFFSKLEQKFYRKEKNKLLTREVESTEEKTRQMHLNHIR